MKTLFLSFVIFMGFQFVYAQNNEDIRFIEVTGSAEMEVEPDEIVFEITYSEYWKEEYQKGKSYDDYITKISLENIEKELESELLSLGYKKEQFIYSDITSITSWRGQAKGFQKTKSLQLSLKEIDEVNVLMNSLETRGITEMGIIQLKNKNITQYRRDVKIEAMKAAKEKATYMLESVDENIGKIISVIELQQSNGLLLSRRDLYSNSIMTNASSENTNDKVKKIKLKYEVKVRFEIL